MKGLANQLLIQRRKMGLKNKVKKVVSKSSPKSSKKSLKSVVMTSLRRLPSRNSFGISALPGCRIEDGFLGTFSDSRLSGSQTGKESDAIRRIRKPVVISEAKSSGKKKSFVSLKMFYHFWVRLNFLNLTLLVKISSTF